MKLHLASVLALALGCGRPSPAQPVTPPPAGLTGVPAWLAKDLFVAARLGATDGRVLITGAGITGDSLGLAYSPDSKKCTVLLARGSETTSDVDLFVYGDDGTWYGSDERANKDATVVLCPPHPARLYLTARVASGYGRLAIGVATVDKEHADSIERSFAGERLDGPTPRRHGGWPALNEAASARARNMPGQWVHEKQILFPVAPEAPTHFTVALRAHSCSDLLLVPATEVAHLSVSAVPMDGEVLGEAAAFGDARGLLMCSEEPAELTIRVRPHAGQGMVAVLLARADFDAVTSSRQAIWLGASAPETLEQAQTQSWKRAERRSRKRARVVARGTSATGRRERHPLSAPAACYRYELLSAAPTRSIAGWLWDGAGKMVSKSSGTHRLALYGCGRTHRVDVEVTERGGKYLVERTRLMNTPPALKTLPIAAARLLAALDGISSTTEPNIQPIPVVSRRLNKVNVVVAGGSCKQVIFTLGEGQMDAELRVAEDSARARSFRGLYTAQTRLCSPNAEFTTFSLELHANRGAGTALLTTVVTGGLTPKKPSLSPPRLNQPSRGGAMTP